MSHKTSTYVFHESTVTGNDRLVLLVLADNAWDDGSHCYPSIETIALKARVARRTVLRCIDRLEAVGEIIVQRSKGRVSNRYFLTLGRTVEQTRRELGLPADGNSATLTLINTEPEQCHSDTTTDPQQCQTEPPTVHPGGTRSLNLKSNPNPATEEAGDHTSPQANPTLCEQVRRNRLAAGLPTARWSDKRILAAIEASLDEGYNPHDVEPALFAVAVDPETQMPGRLVGAGRWWDARAIAERAAKGQPTSRIVLDLDPDRAEREAAKRVHEAAIAALRASLPAHILDELFAEAYSTEESELGFDGVKPTPRMVERRAVAIARKTGLLAQVDVDEVSA